jgi:hypothetical protein
MSTTDQTTQCSFPYLSTTTKFYIQYETNPTHSKELIVGVSRNEIPRSCKTKTLEIPNPKGIGTNGYNELCFGILRRYEFMPYVESIIDKERLVCVPSYKHLTDRCLWISTEEEAQKFCKKLSRYVKKGYEKGYDTLHGTDVIFVAVTLEADLTRLEGIVNQRMVCETRVEILDDVELCSIL